MAALRWCAAWLEAAKSVLNTRVKQTVKIGTEPNAQISSPNSNETFKPFFEVQECLVSFKLNNVVLLHILLNFREDSKQKHKNMAGTSMFALFLA